MLHYLQNMSIKKYYVICTCKHTIMKVFFQTIELGGISRRTERHVSWCENPNYVKILVWGATISEPAPWSPVLEDHANLHLYQITGQVNTIQC